MTILLFFSMYKPDNSNFQYKFLLAHGQALKVVRLWLLLSKVMSYHHFVYTHLTGARVAHKKVFFLWGESDTFD